MFVWAHSVFNSPKRWFPARAEAAVFHRAREADAMARILGMVNSDSGTVGAQPERAFSSTTPVEKPKEKYNAYGELSGSSRLAFSTVNHLSMTVLHGRAGRLTALFGGFCPGQYWRCGGRLPRSLSWPRVRSHCRFRNRGP